MGEVIVGAAAAIAGGLVATLVAERRQDRRDARQRRDATRAIALDVTRELINAADAVVDAATWLSLTTEPFEGEQSQHPLMQALRRLHAAVTDVKLLGNPELDGPADDVANAAGEVYRLAVRIPNRPTTDEMRAAVPPVGVAKRALLAKVHELVGPVAFD